MRVQGSENQVGKQKGDWSPYEQILVFTPKAKGQFRLDEAVIGELVVLAGTTVLPVKHMMKCRPNIELGLKIGDVCEAYVRDSSVEPQRWSILAQAQPSKIAFNF